MLYLLISGADNCFSMYNVKCAPQVKALDVNVNFVLQFQNYAVLRHLTSVCFISVV
jgi:hypothetical protein